MNLKKFEAETAIKLAEKANKEKKIVASDYSKEFSKVLNLIYKQSKKGVLYVNIKYALSTVTIESLKVKGFAVTDLEVSPSVYKISWEG